MSARPSTPGWYWVWHANGVEPQILRLIEAGDGLAWETFAGLRPVDVDYFVAFQGPLRPEVTR